MWDSSNCYLLEEYSQDIIIIINPTTIITLQLLSHALVILGILHYSYEVPDLDCSLAFSYHYSVDL